MGVCGDEGGEVRVCLAEGPAVWEGEEADDLVVHFGGEDEERRGAGLRN